MALSAAAATFNTAVDTLIAAWETYMDTLSTGADVPLVPVCRGNGGTTTYNPGRMSTVASGTDANVVGTPYRLNAKKGTATSWPIAVENPGGALLYLFHKITNSAGDLT